MNRHFSKRKIGKLGKFNKTLLSSSQNFLERSKNEKEKIKKVFLLFKKERNPISFP